MLLIDTLSEQKILQAQQEGAFENLAGSHQPLKLDDDTLIPKEMRAAYRIMKNSGLLPPEVSLRKDISNIDSLITQSISCDQRQSLLKKKNMLLIQLRGTNPNSPLLNEHEYFLKYSNKK